MECFDTSSEGGGGAGCCCKGGVQTHTRKHADHSTTQKTQEQLGMLQLLPAAAAHSAQHSTHWRLAACLPASRTHP